MKRNRKKRRALMQDAINVNDVIVYVEKRAGADKTEKELLIRSIDNGKIFGYDAQGQQHLLSISNLNMRAIGEKFFSIEEFIDSRKSAQGFSIEDLLNNGEVFGRGKPRPATNADVVVSAYNSKDSKRVNALIHNSINGHFKKGDCYKPVLSPDLKRLYFIQLDSGYILTTSGSGTSMRIQFNDNSDGNILWNRINNVENSRILRSWKYDSKCKSYYITIEED